MTPAWWLAAAVASVALASARPVHADAKTQALIPGYDKEANACDVRAAGLDKVVAGAVEMATALSKPDADLEADLVKLQAARDTVHHYCDAVAAMLQLLRADPSAGYKSLEKQIDDGDNKIRALRKANQHTIDDTAPIIARLIPRINARRAAGDTGPLPRTTRTFPSGREVLLPSLPGTWRVWGGRDDDVLEYREAGAMLSLEVRASRAVSCDQQAPLIAKRAATVDWQREAPSPKVKHEAWLLLWPTGAVWKASYTTGGRFVQVACVQVGAGSALVTLDEPDAGRLAHDVNDVAALMTDHSVAAMSMP
jgi:hypothetical protein